MNVPRPVAPIEHDPILAALDAAPELDEHVSEEEERLVAEAKAEVAGGAEFIAHDEAMRRVRARLAGE